MGITYGRSIELKHEAEADAEAYFKALKKHHPEWDDEEYYFYVMHFRNSAELERQEAHEVRRAKVWEK